jgi:putative hydrolase of the HAD superfamily
MRAAENEHWTGVEGPMHVSGDPAALVSNGFARLGLSAGEADALAVVDGYAAAVSGWSRIYDDSVATLQELRGVGHRLGLLSNTWWAAAWHNADLATHGLDALLDATLYTSEVPHSKPHPSVFLEAARRLGVAPEACVMVGDRMIDDVSGAQSAGMRGIWKRNAHTPVRDDIRPDAVVDRVAEVPAIVAGWAVRSSVQESAL